jgi:hypothetical protein
MLCHAGGSELGRQLALTLLSSGGHFPWKSADGLPTLHRTELLAIVNCTERHVT